MTRQIFRKAALDRLASPERLDQLMQVTSPRSWIALAALGMLLSAAFAWALLGTVATTVEGRGVLIRAGGIKTVAAPRAGIVLPIQVQAGDAVAKNQKLINLAAAEPGGQGPLTVVSPWPARILERIAKERDAVEAGTPLLILEPLDQPLLTRLYLPIGVGYQIQPGMPVQVWPTYVNPSEFGYLLGRVRGAAKFPITQAEMLRRIQNEDLVRELAAAGPCLQILVELTADSKTASGYRWSSSKGARLHLYSGSLCQARIIVGQRRPIQFVFPSLAGP